MQLGPRSASYRRVKGLLIRENRRLAIGHGSFGLAIAAGEQRGDIRRESYEASIDVNHTGAHQTAVEVEHRSFVGTAVVEPAAVVHQD